MQYLYIATTFAAAVVMLLTSLLMFARRKGGERSRVILAFILFFSVVSYSLRFSALCQGEEPDLLISVPMLLVAIFMSLSYILYPIEVISPGYLTIKRILLLYTPMPVLLVLYWLSLRAGVIFHPYHSLVDMLTYASQFHVWFCLLLVLLFFAPVLFIFLTPYTRRYNNADKEWMVKYTLAFTINTLAYIVVLLNDSMVVKILYYYVSVGCSLYIAYMELFERLIIAHQPLEEKVCIESMDKPVAIEPSSVKQHPLCERIIRYMNQTCAYRDPDLSLNKLAASLYTNRTTLTIALHELGYSSFNAYINTLRIEEFIRSINAKPSANYQDAFYDVGFRSRATALRNFKQYTGKNPSEYFSN